MTAKRRFPHRRPGRGRSFSTGAGARAACLFLLLSLLPACTPTAPEWNGEVRYTHVSMGIDETSLYEYAGAVDYEFVGQILEADYVIKDECGTST